VPGDRAGDPGDPHAPSRSDGLRIVKVTMVSREEGLLYISLSIMNLGALIKAWRNGEDRNMLSASVASAA
jgi:hypothetical protein